MRISALILCAGLLAGCRTAKEAYHEIAGPESGRHRITVTQLALSETDFTDSALGNPKPIRIRALKDGAEVFSTRVEGYRGPKDPGVSFEIDYDPRSRYEFKIDEVSVVTSGREWNWASAKPGEWIFDAKRKNFGAGSSIEFRDEKVP